MYSTTDPQQNHYSAPKCGLGFSFAHVATVKSSTQGVESLVGAPFSAITSCPRRGIDAVKPRKTAAGIASHSSHSAGKELALALGGCRALPPAPLQLFPPAPNRFEVGALSHPREAAQPQIRLGGF